MPSLPPAPGRSDQPGLAGAITGISDSCLVVAGGANFPDTPPWKGGRKHFHDRIYLLRKEADTLNEWIVLPDKLPQPIAYPAMVQVIDGFLSAGGENENGPLKTVYHWQVREGKLIGHRLPDLPVALTAAGGARMGHQVYVAGGLGHAGAASSFYRLDMDSPDVGWVSLAEMPCALSHAVVVSQSDGKEECIYVIGGRNKSGPLTEFFNTTLKFVPSESKWIVDRKPESAGGLPNWSAGMGLAVGHESILLIGGDEGKVFHQIEQLNQSIEAALPDQRENLLLEKETLLNNHPGFTNQLRVYNTRTTKWTVIGQVPGLTPVTAVAVLWEGIVVIPSGEVRPGVRTENVLGAQIEIIK